MKRPVILLIAHLLCACSAGHKDIVIAPEPPSPARAAVPAPAPPPPPVQVRTVRVRVPVTRPCQAKLAPRPKYVDEDSEVDTGAFAMVEKLRAGIAQRKAREKQLEAALTACGVAVR